MANEFKYVYSNIESTAEMYRNIVETANEGIWTLDADLRITYANNKIAEMLGYSQDEMIGKQGINFVDKEYKKYTELRTEKRKQGIDEVHENKLVRKDGSTLWAFINSKSLFDKDGKFIGILAMLTDITERKLAEDALRLAYENIQVQHEELQAQSDEFQIQNGELQSQAEELGEAYAIIQKNEERYKMLFSNMSEAFILAEVIYDNDCKPYDFRFIEVNPVYERLSGYTQAQLIGKTMLQVFPNTRPITIEKYCEVIITNSAVHFEILSNVVSGKFFDVNAYSPEKGRLAVILRDIAKRKRAEEALLESEEKSRHLIKYAPAGIYEMDFSVPKYTSVNDIFCEMSGYTREELLAIDPFKLMDEKSIGKFAERIRKINAGEEISPQEEYLVVGKYGQKLWVLINAQFKHKDGKIVGAVVVAHDITERKLMEEELREAYEKLQGQSEELQVSNEELRVQSDELVEANVSLHDSVIGFRTLADNSPDLIARFDRQNHCLYANPAIKLFYDTPFVATFYGLSAKEFANKTGSEVQIDPEMMKLSKKQRDNVFTTGKPESMEFQYVSPQGKEYYFDTRLIPEFINGKVVSVLVLSHDITKLKKAEAKLKETLDNLENLVKERTSELEESTVLLKESEQRLNEAQRIAHVGSWEWDMLKNETWCSDEMYRIFGFDRYDRQVSFGTLLNCIHPDDQHYVDNAVQSALQGEPFCADYRIIRDDGNERILYEQGEVVFDEQGIPVKMRGTVLDITQQKHGEERLRQSEEKYRNIVEMANEGIVTTNADSVLIYANNKFAEFLGYNVDECVNVSLWKFIDDGCKALVTAKLARRRQGIDEGYELKLVRRNGTSLWIHLNAKPLFYKGKYAGAMYMFTDINERKRIESALAKVQLARQKEIHHRIKNNLQIISSLLDLQSEQFKGKKFIKETEVLDAFKDSQDRVVSMALIHEELHKGKQPDTINFSEYIVKLAQNLFKTYSVGNNNTKLITDVDHVYFDMDTAIPLGIIINELISNSLKYAFSGRNDGEINIALCQERASEYTIDKVNYSKFILKVSDNGEGIPESVDIENTETLGMQLVRSLVDQLDGELKVKRENGTSFIFRFSAPVNEGK